MGKNLVRNFDPINDEMDFRELERIAREGFARHRDAIVAWRGERGDGEIRVERAGGLGEKRSVRLTGELDSLSAMANPGIEQMGLRLGGREIFSRMLDYYAEEDFPVLTDIRNGKDVSFEEAWEACMRHVNDQSSWEAMARETTSREFSTKYYTWTQVTLDPNAPEDARVKLESAYSIESPFLLPEENKNGGLVSFPEWIRRSGKAELRNHA